MEKWSNIGDIIANFNFKGRAKKKFLSESLKDRIKRVFGIKEDFEIEIFKEKLEIKIKNNILAQEMLLEKEQIREEVEKVLKELEPEVRIKEILIKKT